MEINYQLLAQQLLAEAAQQSGVVRHKHTSPSSTPTTTYGHGNGGLFSHHALEQPVFSAMILPHQGLQGRLELFPNRSTDPLYGIMTGVTATTGSEPTGPCDDPPVAGLTKLCSQSTRFARQSRMSRVFELDRIGQHVDRGEHFDLRLLGNPGAEGGPNTPTIPGLAAGSVLNYEYAKAAFELAVAWSRDFAREFYTGNPANDTASGGRKYYRGLDLLINTGYRDAVSGTVCPAADSIVWSFGGNNVATNGGKLVREMTSVYRRLKYIAASAGLMPVKWVIAMRWSAFYEMTEIWPCAYTTYRCASAGTFSASQPQVTDSRYLTEMRDEMRGDMYNYTGQYLIIDGERVEVVIDDSIREDGIGAGVFDSDVYFVPLTVLGGVPATFMEYYPYAGADAPGSSMEFAQQMGVGSFYKTSDNSRFLWHFKPPTNFCVQFLVKTEPRLILRTPYLAARFTNIRYQPVEHEREGFTDATYFVDGGSTSQPGPSYYTPSTNITR